MVDHSALIADLPRLMRIARGLGLSHHDAEDLVQAAVVRILPRWDTVGADPHPYLRTVLTNLFIDRLRHATVLTVEPVGLSPDDDRPPDVVDGADRTALRVDLERALDTLTPLVRTVLILRFLDGQTIAATARILQRPEGTIARITSEGIAVLRQASVLSPIPERRPNG